MNREITKDINRKNKAKEDSLQANKILIRATFCKVQKNIQILSRVKVTLNNHSSKTQSLQEVTLAIMKVMMNLMQQMLCFVVKYHSKKELSLLKQPKV